MSKPKIDCYQDLLYQMLEETDKYVHMMNITMDLQDRLSSDDFDVMMECYITGLWNMVRAVEDLLPDESKE